MSIGFIRVIVLLVAIFSLASGGEARKVTVGVPNHAISYVAFYIANEKGYYREEDLEVQIIQMSAPLANLSLISGNVDFTSVPTAAMNAAIRGAPLHIVFNAFEGAMFWLYGRREIRDVRDLKGKKVGASGGASAADLLLRDVLAKHGLDPGRDVPILGMGDSRTRLGALLSGTIDAAVLTSPWNFKAEESGMRELVSFIQEGMVLLTGSVVTTDKLLKTEPDVVEKFIRGTLKALIYARENRAGTIPILARNTRTADDLSAKIYDLAKPAMGLDGTVSEESQKKAVSLLLKTQGLKDSPPLNKLFDFALTRKIHGELQSRRWKPVP
jgi:ABC-type nitrate/sulfonate/bicarbonate transport system substrate-binding protein